MKPMKLTTHLLTAVLAMTLLTGCNPQVRQMYKESFNSMMDTVTGSYKNENITTRDPVRGYIRHYWGNPPKDDMQPVANPGNVPESVTVYSYGDRRADHRIEAIADTQWFYYLNDADLYQTVVTTSTRETSAELKELLVGLYGKPVHPDDPDASVLHATYSSGQDNGVSHWRGETGYVTLRCPSASTCVATWGSWRYTAKLAEQSDN